MSDEVLKPEIEIKVLKIQLANAVCEYKDLEKKLAVYEAHKGLDILRDAILDHKSNRIKLMMQAMENKMTEKDFVYWLNGFLELSGMNELNAKQVEIIKDHIKLVINKKTPDYTRTTSTHSIPCTATASDAIFC